MKTLLKQISVLFFPVLLFTFGCQKDASQPNDPVVSPTSRFTWTPSSGATVVADNFYYITAYNNIVASKTGNLTSVDIILESLSVGTHTISPSKGITLEYVYSGTTYSGKSGVVNITSNSAGLITGNFNAALTGGTITAISGEFTDLREK
ncbi:MAG: hypothetical protein PSX36_05455 [bacterium]|nr:hypothetical protein [bacterium]